MEIRFEDDVLRRLEAEADFDAGFSQALVKAVRKRLNMIRAAADERTFYALKSLHYEKLKGDRSHERSMKLNDQWRLIVRIEESPKTVVVVSVEDYH